MSKLPELPAQGTAPEPRPGHADLLPPSPHPAPPQQALPRCSLCPAKSPYVLGCSSNSTSSGKPSPRASSTAFPRHRTTPSIRHVCPLQPFPSALRSLAPKNPHRAVGGFSKGTCSAPAAPRGQKRVQGAGRAGCGYGTLRFLVYTARSPSGDTGRGSETDLGQPGSASFSSW